MKTVSKPALPVKGARRTLKLPAKIRRACRATAPRPSCSRARSRRFQGRQSKAEQARCARSKLVGVSSASPVVDRQAIEGQTKTLPRWSRRSKSAVNWSRTRTARSPPTRSSTPKSTARPCVSRPHIDDTKQVTMPEVGCPTADGKLKTEHTSSEGGTVMVLKGAAWSNPERSVPPVFQRGRPGRSRRPASVRQGHARRRCSASTNAAFNSSDDGRTHHGEREGDDRSRAPRA